MDLSTLNTFQQAILFILLILGSAILVSSTVLMVRKRAFEAKLKGVSEEREASRRASTLELNCGNDGTSREGAVSTNDLEIQGCQPRIKPRLVRPGLQPDSLYQDEMGRWVDDDQITVADSQLRHHHHHRVFPMAGIGARPDLHNHPRDVVPTSVYAEDSTSGLKGIVRDTQKYFFSRGWVTRNSQFYGLTSSEREKLGGVEYRAISFLSVIVSLYLFMFLLLGIVGVGGWLSANHPEVTRSNGLNPFWTGAFFAVSAFVNSGMSLLDQNMVALQLKYEHAGSNDKFVLR